MDLSRKALRVLYSFPHRIGAARICTTAWHQVAGLAEAGAHVTLYTASLARPFSSEVDVHRTLEFGSFRVPARILGSYRYCVLHDWLVAAQLRRMAGKIDVVHVWPLGAKQTIAVAKRLGIPTFLERPNAHTRFAYEVVREECEKLGISMPPGHEHDYDPATLKREELEYASTDFLLCPSEFVARTFTDRGFLPKSIVRHQYGYDDEIFRPKERPLESKGLTVLFAGGCAPRKGLHYALDAWLASSAHKTGTFLIAGAFIPGYAEVLAKQLAHPSVKVLGHRSDLPQLMQQSDVLVLPSIEEGSALVTSEARGSGCILLVSEAAGAICANGVDALVHPVGDVKMLTEHFELLATSPTELRRLRTASLSTLDRLTWSYAGRLLRSQYERAIGINRA